MNREELRAEGGKPLIEATLTYVPAGPVSGADRSRLESGADYPDRRLYVTTSVLWPIRGVEGASARWPSLTLDAPAIDVLDTGQVSGHQSGLVT